VQVHHRGDRGVDGILRLIELAGHDGGLEVMLGAMCDEIAAIAGADVASVYVREDARLVMRGNHGFAAAAVGTTVLAVGEGITGLVAECMRPISAAHAAAEAAYKHVPHLGEERYPAFLGVPLIGNGSAIGVLVLQRRQRRFTSDEVTLATALGAPVTLAIERRRANAVRSARLTGVGHVGGAVLGRAAIVPTTTALASGGVDRQSREPLQVASLVDHQAGNHQAGKRQAGNRPAHQAPERLELVFARLREDVARATRRLTDAVDRSPGVCPVDPATGAALDRFALALVDARLRERIAEHADRAACLRSVARDYARAPYRLGTSQTTEHAAERAAEIEELCALLGEDTLRAGAVWIADRIHAFVAIAAVARGASALIASDAVSLAAIAIARAAGIPVVSDVIGLFGWIRPGDLLAIDGERGVVLVHPPPGEIERLRSVARANRAG
jgi:phosphotransferase system, enzyme I, PtsP